MATMGLLIILFGDKYPKLIAVVATLTFGFWCGIMVQERQDADKSFGLPSSWDESRSLPGIVAVVAAGAAGLLVHFARSAALVVLTAGVITLACASVFRLVNINPAHVYDSEGINYKALIGIGVFVIILCLCLHCLVKKFHNVMLMICGALLGCMLLVSGISYLSQRGSDQPVSLLDDLARTVTNVKSGRCRDSFDERGCHCGHGCKIEILLWLLCSAIVLIVRLILYRRREKMKKRYTQMDNMDEGSESPQKKSEFNSIIGKSNLDANSKLDL